MFYGKRIKALELRIDALEKKIHELTLRVQTQNADIDKLYELYAAREKKKEQELARTNKPKPRRCQKSRAAADGKENPKNTK